MNCYACKFLRSACLAALAAAGGCDRAELQDVSSPPPSPPLTARSEVRVLKPRPTPEPPPTPGQVALKKKLETQLTADRPSHRITLRNRRVVEGQIVNETSTTIMLREDYGYSGSIISAYKRTEIASVETLCSANCEVTYQDVALAEQFPGFHFTKSRPYSIVTDAPYADVERALRLLAQLREQFERHFAALIRPGHALQNIQVVFFSTEEPFRTYTRKVAPVFVNSAGFYSASENRLVLLNQLGSTQYAKVQDHITQRRRELDALPNVDPNDLHQASTRLASLRSEMTFEAKSMTERVIRHEGAHQLLAAHGIQSHYGIEPAWLSEGLAQYCEPSEIGGYHFVLAERLAKARDELRLLPLKTLLNHRDNAGFFSLGERNVEIAYAQSWALTYFLLHGPRRAKFLDYMKSLRDINTDAAAIAAYKAEPETLLLTALGVDLKTLDTQWQQFVRRL